MRSGWDIMFLRLPPADLGVIVPLWKTWDSWDIGHVLEYVSVSLHYTGSVELSVTAWTWKNDV